MRLLFLSCVFFIIFNNCAAQTELSKISSKNFLKDFTAISFNDSTLITYNEVAPSSGVKYKRTTWLRPDGSFRSDNFATEIVSIAQFDSTVYYYTFNEKKGESALSGLFEKAGPASRKPFPSEILLRGKVIAFFQDKNLFVVSFHEGANQISITEINGMTAVNEKKFSLPIPFSKYFETKSDFEFFNKSSPLNTFMGWAKVKLYWYNNLYITIDQPAIPEGKSKSAQTLVFILHGKNESVEHFAVAEELKDDFRTFILDGKLFRNSISKNQFVLSIYDLTSRKLLTRETILKGQIKFNLCFRHGRSNSITLDSFEHMMQVAESCDPSVVVLKDSAGYTIQWGSYFDDQDASTPEGTMRLAGINRYFFYDWSSTSNSFNLDETPDLVRYRIDKYELEQTALKRLFSFKGYVSLGSGVLGMYYENAIKSVSFVRFE